MSRIILLSVLSGGGVHAEIDRCNDQYEKLIRYFNHCYGSDGLLPANTATLDKQFGHQGAVYNKLYEHYSNNNLGISTEFHTSTSPGFQVVTDSKKDDPGVVHHEHRLSNGNTQKVYFTQSEKCQIFKDVKDLVEQCHKYIYEDDDNRQPKEFEKQHNICFCKEPDRPAIQQAEFNGAKVLRLNKALDMLTQS